MSIILLDSRAGSLTISWPGTKLAQCYLLEYRTAESDWEFLSDSIRQTQVRKKNLDPECAYFFRVAAMFDDGPGAWMDHEEGYYPLTQEEEDYAMDAPRVKMLEHECLVVKWDPVEEAYGYELQMRENTGGAEWFTVANEIEVTQVKKRKLKSRHGYSFRVRPLNGQYDEAFSPPSEVKVAVVTKENRGRNSNNPTSPASTDNFSMPAPWVKNAGPQALLIRWTQFKGATGYELQMRVSTRRGEWTTIAERLTGTEVKKKNLTNVAGYQFRVRPLGTKDNRFSAPSYAAIASQAPARGARRHL